jgi:hypothetical protein
VDKLTYNHSSSYPKWLGKATLEFFQKADSAQLAAAASRVKLVLEDAKPTKAQRACVAKYLSSAPGANGGDFARGDWYDTLRLAQGNWGAWYAGLPYMVEYSGFMFGGCEWAYVYDVATEQLEVYASADEPLGLGRYNHVDAEGYVGARMLMALPLNVIQGLNPAQVEFVCNFVTQQEKGRSLERGDDQLPQSALLKGRKGTSAWRPLAPGWEIQIDIDKQRANCRIRAECVEIEATVGDGLLLGHPGYGAALVELLDAEICGYTTAIYGGKATVAHYRKVMRFRNGIRKFEQTATGMPLLALILDCNQWLGLRLTKTYFEQVKKAFVKHGLTNQAWKFLVTQPHAVLCEVVDTLEYHTSGMAFGALQLNLIAASMQTEKLVCGRVKAVLDGVLRVCGWGSWSSREGVHDRSTPVNRENAGIMARALMRGDLTFEEAESVGQVVSDVADYVRSLGTPLLGATWQSLMRRSHQWHRDVLAAEMVKAEATWEAELGVYSIDGYLALELNSAKLLFEEGMELHHCVKAPSYVDDCLAGECRIFSLRQDGIRQVTVELRPAGGDSWKVEQIRGKYNSVITDSKPVEAAARLVAAYSSAKARSRSLEPSTIGQLPLL